MKTKKGNPSESANQSVDKKIVYVKDLKGEAQSIRFTNTTAIHPALKQYFCYSLMKASNQTKIDLDQALIPFQFSTVHFAILSVLAQENAPTQNQVADQMGIDKASMVKLIDHMESLQMVARVSGEDRRCKLLHLTDYGISIFKKAQEAAKEAEEKFLKNLTPEEQKIIKRLIPLLLP